MFDEASDIIGQQPMKAHVAKSQFGPALAQLLLPVGPQRGRRMATADRVLPGAPQLVALLREIATEIRRRRCLCDAPRRRHD